MKSFDELTDKQQETAIEKEAVRTLRFITEGYPAPSIVLQEIANEVGTEMESTPWFFGEVMWERAATLLKELVYPWVKEQVFAEKGDPEVVWGIC